MAKAKQVPDIGSAADLSEWAAGVLCLRFDEVLSFSNAVLVPDNVHGVHDMRVALRRLRSALRDFAGVMDDKRLGRFKKDLKRISDALGPVRDNDVSIISLENYTADADDEDIKKGIATLIAELRSERERSHNRFCKTLARVPLESARDGIDDALRQSGLFRPATIKAAGRDVIKSRLADLCDLIPAIYDPFDGERLHAIRIAVKRLRYSIGLFGTCWGDELGRFTSELSGMQDHLGAVHDSDIWIERLSGRLKNKGKPNDQPVRLAAMWLLSKFVKVRSSEYRAALDLWAGWQTSGFVDNLNALIDPD